MKSDAQLKTFTLPVRVYYEDTDAAGVVYYANYLKFFERCRTELIRSLGYDQFQLAKEHQIAFVVKNVTAEYHKPARLDDALTVNLTVKKLGRAQILFEQNIHRDELLLVAGTVQIVCVDPVQMKAKAIPHWLHQQLESL